MVSESHWILGDKVQVYRRERSQYWQCSASLNDRRYRKSTGTDSLSQAKEVAEDWYFELRGKSRAGLLAQDKKTFRDVAQAFLKEYEVITAGERSQKWTEGHDIRLRVHLTPFFGDMGISEVTAGKVQEYRVQRMNSAGQKNAESKSNRPPSKKAPSRNTIHNEIITLRQVLKTAVRHGWLSALPDLSTPYKTKGKIIHRPWFSPAEYKQLYAATRKYAKAAPKRFRWEAEQVHDYVLFLANTGLRPDEAKNLQHRDVEIVTDRATGETILEIEVRGKRGVGYCKSMPGAVRPYERLLKRPKPGARKQKVAEGDEAREEDGDAPVALPEPDDHVFPGNHIKLFNGLLTRTNLKLDRDKKPRTAYSLRHTYICMRLMEGADIYQIAKNCRTSVEMIEKFYAAHIKDALDASLINVRRPREPERQYEREDDDDAA